MRPLAAPTPPARPVRWQKVLLPTEHGSWGFVLEPLALGLLAAPSPAGAALAFAAFAAFASRRPWQLFHDDRRRGRRDRRTAAEAGAVAVLGLLAAAGLLAAWRLAGAAPLLALVPAVPLAAAFAVWDARREVRGLLAETVAPVAFAALPAAIGLAGGLGPVVAGALAVAIIARAVPTVLYVRARLRLNRGRAHAATTAIAAQATALTGIAALVGLGWLPPPAVVGYLVLLARAAFGLSPARRPITPQRLGILELLYGALTVVGVAAGFWGYSR